MNQHHGHGPLEPGLLTYVASLRLAYGANADQEQAAQAPAIDETDDSWGAVREAAESGSLAGQDSAGNWGTDGDMAEDCHAQIRKLTIFQEEQWDIYYHDWLLHSCLHSDCYYYKDTWWFPEPGRNEETLHMFTPSRHPPINDLKFYDMHLPDGTTFEHMMFRYVGTEPEHDNWLQDYTGYNLNMVTFDMRALTPPGM
ncbi:hypothetical protein JCM24511_03938 [Saitozyma sp. JCM 24511]|nr:hypothetical protein JCM24511_03938 [Saitozyma sp. JCM 24511]